jgi:hypothetical protein
VTMEPKYEYLRPPRTALADAGSHISSPCSRPQTYCNRAGSCWYATDKQLR